MDNYLALPAIADFIVQYEQTPTTENLKTMITCLLTYGFDPENGWFMKWQEDEENGHSNCFVMKIVGDEKILHTIVKIVHDQNGSHSDTWDQSIPQLLTAPLPDDRCWAILVHGMKVRLYEYHRNQNPDACLVPCDFKINDKLKHAVHIRKNASEVQNILIGIPVQHPRPLENLELEGLSLKESPGNITPASKPTDGDVPESTVTAENCESLADPPAQVHKVTLAAEEPLIELDPVTEAEPTNLPTTSTSFKPATKGKSTTKDKAATKSKAATKDKTATKKKTTTETKSAIKSKATLPKLASSTKATPTASHNSLLETDTNEATSN